MKHSIAIIDPDEACQSNLISELTLQGFSPEGFVSAETFIEDGRLSQWKLVICEVVLPGISGIELCTRLKNRRESENIQVIFSSVRKTETDRLIGLSVGGTDYVTKPYSPRELALRARAVLLRSADADPSAIATNGCILLDLQSEKVFADSVPLRLSRIDYRILRALLRNVGKVFSRKELLEEVWGDHSWIHDRSVDAHIQILRAKLGAAREDLETIQGVGYRIRKHEEVCAESTRLPANENVDKPLNERHSTATEGR